MPDIQMGWHRPRVQWSRDSGPAAALQIALVTLIVLKLTGVIAWSWVVGGAQASALVDG